MRGTYGYYSWRQFGTQGDVRTNNLGLFVQDSWTPNDRLTLNLGLRVEKEEVPSYVEGLNGINFGFGDKIAPRVGATYDLKGDGKWKVYGSYGMYYDLFKLELPRGAFGGDKWIEKYYTLNTLDWPTIGPNGNFPGTFIEESNLRIPSNDPSCPECGAIDPDLKPMRQTEFTAGLEHEFNSSLSLGLRFVHKQIDRAIEDIGVHRAWHRRSVLHRQPRGRRDEGHPRRRLPSLPQGAARLRRHRSAPHEALQQQVARRRHLSVCPSLWQLLWTGELG